MSPGVTFERVYLALKEQLGSGRFAAGEHLDPNSLSADLNASVTPVRDALHRLVGEGLVEAPRGDGFRTPYLTEIGFRHLYRWNLALLDLAARAPSAKVEDLKTEIRSDPVDRTEALFLAVASLSGNSEHVAALTRLNERLRPVRRIEIALVAEVEVEIAALERHLQDEDRRKLRATLAAYHKRRERLAAEIVERLHPR